MIIKVELSSYKNNSFEKENEVLKKAYKGIDIFLICN